MSKRVHKQIELMMLTGFFVMGNIAFAQTPPTESFTLAPAHPNAVKPAVFIYELKPGDTLTDEVIVSNENPEKQQFWLYAADQKTEEKNVFEIYRPEDKPENNFIATWVVPEKKEFELNGQSKEVIKINISIPKEAPLGEYSGGLAFERRKAEINNPNLTLAYRVIHKISIKVTNDPQPVPKLESNAPSPYLIGSVVLFLASISYYFYASLKEKHHKKHGGQK